MPSRGVNPMYAIGLTTTEGVVETPEPVVTVYPPLPTEEEKQEELRKFVENATAAQLKDLIAKGDLDLEEVIEAEKAGKNRGIVLAMAK